MDASPSENEVLDLSSPDEKQGTASSLPNCPGEKQLLEACDEIISKESVTVVGPHGSQESDDSKLETRQWL